MFLAAEEREAPARLVAYEVVSGLVGHPESGDRLREKIEAALAAADFVCTRAARLQAEAARKRAEARRLVRRSRAALRADPISGDVFGCASPRRWHHEAMTGVSPRSDQRDWDASHRDDAAERRDGAAEHRDERAEERDQAADARRTEVRGIEGELRAGLRRAGLRDAAAAQRDEEAGRREDSAVGAGLSPEELGVLWKHARADREAAAADRAAAGADRYALRTYLNEAIGRRAADAGDRGAADSDRRAAASDRDRAHTDRDAASADRQQSAVERAMNEHPEDLS
ncbi:hypothetical protein GCM10023214_23990 [Amycolatopsis dongchuanensis]|uniref:DUF222 domain-containing protein n=2 Tax=Pseudonocardiaceae TaxID=2070 RepID=A0ABP9QDW6_9PSEU